MSLIPEFMPQCSCPLHCGRGHHCSGDGKLEVLLCLLIVIGSLWRGTMMTPTMVRTAVISAVNCGNNTLVTSASSPEQDPGWGVSETWDCVLCSAGSVFCVLCSHCLVSSCKCSPSPQAAAVSADVQLLLPLVTEDQENILLASPELWTGDLINNGNIFHR